LIVAAPRRRQRTRNDHDRCDLGCGREQSAPSMRIIA
jgi:hypothetical protein